MLGGGVSEVYQKVFIFKGRHPGQSSVMELWDLGICRSEADRGVGASAMVSTRSGGQPLSVRRHLPPSWYILASEVYGLRQLIYKY